MRGVERVRELPSGSNNPPENIYVLRKRTSHMGKWTETDQKQVEVKILFGCYSKIKNGDEKGVATMKYSGALSYVSRSKNIWELCGKDLRPVQPARCTWCVFLFFVRPRGIHIALLAKIKIRYPLVSAAQRFAAEAQVQNCSNV